MIHGAGARKDAGECGHAELDRGGLPPQGRVDLGELVVGAGEADLQAFGFAGPALEFGFGDAVVQVGADLLQPGALGWVWPQERAPDAGLTEMILIACPDRCGLQRVRCSPTVTGKNLDLPWLSACRRDDGVFSPVRCGSARRSCGVARVFHPE